MADPVAMAKASAEVAAIQQKIAAGRATEQDVARAKQLLADNGGTPQSIDSIDQAWADQQKDSGLSTANDDIVQRILGQAQGDRADNVGYVDKQVAPELDKLRFAQQGAFYNDQQALEKQDATRANVQGAYNKLAGDTKESAGRFNELSAGLWDQLHGTNQGLTASDQAAAAKYATETDPLMRQLSAQGYGADVTADPEGLAAQRSAMQSALGDVTGGGADQKDVMQRYKDLSSPEATAQERYLSEMARRNFEGQDRGNREAVMQNLSQRGLNSGTLQVANNLGAQERLGQDRTLAELGMQANAVGRSMQALQGYGNSANQLRSGNQMANQIYGNQAGELRNANDAISKFNKEQGQITQRFQDQYAADEAKRVGNLAGDRNDATLAMNKGIGDRAAGEETAGQTMLTGNYKREDDTRDAEKAAADTGYETDTAYNNSFADAGQRAFTRQQGVTGAATSIAGVRGGQASTGTGNTLEALKLALGQNESERALIAGRRLV